MSDNLLYGCIQAADPHDPPPRRDNGKLAIEPYIEPELKSLYIEAKVIKAFSFCIIVFVLVVIASMSAAVISCSPQAITSGMSSTKDATGTVTTITTTGRQTVTTITDSTGRVVSTSIISGRSVNSVIAREQREQERQARRERRARERQERKEKRKQ